MSTYIFDFDGTIADSFSIVRDVLLKQAKYLGCRQLSSTGVDNLRNMHTREMLKYLDVQFWKTPWFLEKLRKLINTRVAEVVIFPGWLEVFRMLKSNEHTLGIVSSNSQKTINFFLRKYALHGLFDFIVSGKYLLGKANSLKKLIRDLNLV